MNLEPAIRKNVSFTYYEAGHMKYVEKKSGEKLHKDVFDFFDSIIPACAPRVSNDFLGPHSMSSVIKSGLLLQ